MISAGDRKILRDLAGRVADIAALPVQEERRHLWKKHNSLKSCRPLILLFPEGAWTELLPEKGLQCDGKEARAMEIDLRRRLYTHDHFRDDTVIEIKWPVRKVCSNSGWGLEPKRIPSTEARGSWKFDPVIKGPEDLKGLRFPEIRYDDKATRSALLESQDLFGDILDVKLIGVGSVGYHLMQQYIYLRGLEEMMLDMYEEPQMLHDAMAFLAEGHARILKQYVELNLLSLNNDNTYQNSGGNGYTDELPGPGFDPERVRPCDIWASAESQELTLVSPSHHAEFAVAYESKLLEPFGLAGYGCCEDLTQKLKDVCRMPHMRRISISPFADIDKCAEQLQGRFILSWKPQPAHLVGKFNEGLIRNYIRHALEVSSKNHCVLEMILKDTHTCENRPERFDRWTQIAREEVTGLRA